MQTLIKVLKGIIVGLGGIIPGISGGMIAAVFNIYEELIFAISNIVKHPIASIKSIWEYLIGMVIGIALAIVLIATIFEKYPLPITMLFIGFILGGIPSIMKDIGSKKREWYHYFISVIMVMIMISILFLRPNNIGAITAPSIYFVYGIIGFLIALPIVVPGVSGTMILMTLGLYVYMTDVLSDFIKALVTFNGSGIVDNLLPASIIMISAFIGLLLFAKVISYILKNHRLGFNMAIIGILFISPVNILWTLYVENDKLLEGINIFSILASMFLLSSGYILAYKVTKMGNRKDELDEF